MVISDYPRKEIAYLQVFEIHLFHVKYTTNTYLYT